MSNLIPVREAHRFDEERLYAHLREPLGLSQTMQIEQFAGGQSNPTFLLTCGDARYVLRKKPPGKLLPSAHAVEREYRVMKALASTDVPVPNARLLVEDPDVIGTPFFVMDYLEGRVFADPSIPEVTVDERRAMYDAMNDTLARLHRVDFDAVGLGDYGKPAGYVTRQIARWSKQYEASKTEPIDAMDRLMKWLPEQAPAEDETTIAHGDFRPGNLMFHPTEPRVIAVLDWELSTLGHPLGDLAYFCMVYRLPPSKRDLAGFLGLDIEPLGIPTEEAFVAQYAERTGRAGVANFNFFIAFALFRLAAICQGVYKRSLDGNASDARAGMFGEIAKALAGMAWMTARGAAGS